MRSSALVCLTALFLAATPLPTASQQQEPQVPAPAAVMGFEPGTGGRLASWNALVGYYRLVADASDRVDFRVLGETARGEPFLLLEISSPDNLARKERLAEISRRVADPRGLGDEDVDRLVAEGRAVVAVTVGLHSTEVASMQMAPGLVHRLATADDPETLRVLDETVFLLFPSFNPDGHQMVAQWVERTRGTPWSGSRLPDMYHEYVGHDNNRDAYMLTQNEAKLFAGVVYREWIPQWYLDVHQMGSWSARLYLPPYDDPVNPNVDPMVYVEHEMVGAAMEMAMERAGLSGYVTGSWYEGWWFPSFHMATNHHNIAGMLTESASANMAEPLFVHPDQLGPHGRSHDIYGRMQKFPRPWTGGWWTVADIIRQQHVSTYALLSTAAANRELVLRNMVAKARRTILRGRSEPPLGFVIRAQQHDYLVVDELVRILMANGVEVHIAASDFEHRGSSYRAGDYVVSTAQPKGVLVRSLLGRTFYPDDATTRRDDGTIIPPYDMANFVLAEQMGVAADPLETPLIVDMTLLRDPPAREGAIIGEGGAGWLVSHELNAAFRVTNAVLAAGGQVYWLEEPLIASDRSFGAGTLWIPSAAFDAARAAALARESGVDFTALAVPPVGPAYRLKPLRLGMYRRYLGEQLDEGWSRYLFDTWGFPYTRLEADAIRAGGLAGVDVLLVTADDLETLRGEGDVTPPGEGTADQYPEVFLPPEYTEGLDGAAMGAIGGFVRRGGTLVLLDEASGMAWEELGVPVRDVVEGIPREEYFSPGSNLRVRYDTGHPLAFGMPESGWVLNWGSPVYGIERTPFSGRIRTPVRYGDDDLLRSGWLVGEGRITGRPAALDVEYGAGRILMIGFRAQHRAQTHGTFKVFFNALYYGPAERTVLGGGPGD